MSESIQFNRILKKYEENIIRKKNLDKMFSISSKRFCLLSFLLLFIVLFVFNSFHLFSFFSTDVVFINNTHSMINFYLFLLFFICFIIFGFWFSMSGHLKEIVLYKEDCILTDLKILFNYNKINVRILQEFIDIEKEFHFQIKENTSFNLNSFSANIDISSFFILKILINKQSSNIYYFI